MRIITSIFIALMIPSFASAMEINRPPAEKTTTTTQKAAEAKAREGRTGTSNENAEKGMKDVDKELKDQQGKKK